MTHLLVSKTKEIHQCSLCGREYDSIKDAESCVHSHDIVYVGLRRLDLHDLILFVEQGVANGLHMNESLYNALMSYKRKASWHGGLE